MRRSILSLALLALPLAPSAAAAAPLERLASPDVPPSLIPTAVPGVPGAFVAVDSCGSFCDGGPLMRSTDGGRTWAAVPQPPAERWRVVAGSVGAGVLWSGLSVSVDAGATWSEPLPFPPVGGAVVNAFAEVHPIDADSAFVIVPTSAVRVACFLGRDSTSDLVDRRTLWRTDTAGRSWARRIAPRGDDWIGGVGTAPGDAAHVIAATVRPRRGDECLAGRTLLRESRDGGRTWTTALTAPGEVGEVVLDAAGRVAIALGDGEVRLRDVAGAWHRLGHLQPASPGLTFAPDGRLLVLREHAAYAVFSPDGTPVARPAGLPAGIGAIAFNGDDVVARVRSGLLASSDGGATSGAATVPPAAERFPLPAYLPDGSLAVETTAGLVTREGGAWVTRDGGLPPDAPITGIVSSGGAADGAVYGLVRPGGVYRSQDSGRSWTRVADVGTAADPLLAVDTADWRHVAIGEGRQLRLSTDGGATWSSRRVPGTDVVDVAIRGRAIVVSQASDIARVSRDGGRTWARFGERCTPFVPAVAIAAGRVVIGCGLEVRSARLSGGPISASLIATVTLVAQRVAGRDVLLTCGCGAPVRISRDGGLTWRIAAGLGHLSPPIALSRDGDLAVLEGAVEGPPAIVTYRLPAA